VAARRRNDGEAKELLVELCKRLRKLDEGDPTYDLVLWVLDGLAVVLDSGDLAVLKEMAAEGARRREAADRAASQPLLGLRDANAAKQRLRPRSPLKEGRRIRLVGERRRQSLVREHEFLTRAHVRLYTRSEQVEFLRRTVRAALNMGAALAAARRFTGDATTEPELAAATGAANLAVPALVQAFARCRGLRASMRFGDIQKIESAKIEVARILVCIPPEQWHKHGDDVIKLCARSFGLTRADNLFR